MDFLSFCHLHDVIIDALPPLGVWRYYPTAKAPGKKRGSVKYCGDHGFVMNHQAMAEAALWAVERSEAAKIDYAALDAAMAREAERKQAGYAAAARDAAAILHRCTVGRHPYLEAKGFPEGEGLIWTTLAAERVLIVPMRQDGRLVGCQKIFEDGTKRFMDGQTTKHAVFTMGRGAPVWCEGYATALSVHKALEAARLQRSVVACFSAHTLQTTATSGFVVADNDKSKVEDGHERGMAGQRAAVATGLPYWLSDVVGEDFNDFHRKAGLFVASQALKLAVMRARPAVVP